jgi:hypothetical protein
MDSKMREVLNSLPDTMRNALMKVAKKWGGNFPACAWWREPGPDGKPREMFCRFEDATADLLRKVENYHVAASEKVAVALGAELERLQAEGWRPSPKPARRMARRLAEHMMYANFARIHRNDLDGLPPEQGLPFPLPFVRFSHTDGGEVAE